MKDTFIYSSKKAIYGQIIKWLEMHDGNLPKYVKYPQYTVCKNGKMVTVSKMPKSERIENNLYQRWHLSKEKEILDEYIGRPIEEVPKLYRKKIAKLREFGLGMEKEKELSAKERARIREQLKIEEMYAEIIEWLNNHNGIMPRKFIQNGKKLQLEVFTKEREYEDDLYGRWHTSKLREIVNKYSEVEIENIPEEYREKIAKLREYGIGINVTKDIEKNKNETYKELIKWLETHNGKMPSGQVRKNGILLSISEMSKEEIKQVRLYSAWRRSDERKILHEYLGIPIEEVPEEYREKIATLRKYNLDANAEKYKVTVWQELMEWLENHNGKMPRNTIMSEDGKRLSISEMTEEEKYEKNLYIRWYTSKEGNILSQYIGKLPEEVPEQYREKVSTLRKHIEVSEKNYAEEKMKGCVGKQVGKNRNTRKELADIIKIVEGRSVEDSSKEEM